MRVVYSPRSPFSFRRDSHSSPLLLFVSFTCRNYHSSLFRDDSQHGDGSGVRSPAEVATTTQISFAPPWHRQAQSFHSNYSLVSRPSATCFRWFPPRNGGHTATSKLGYAEFQRRYLFRMLRVQTFGMSTFGISIYIMRVRVRERWWICCRASLRSCNWAWKKCIW